MNRTAAENTDIILVNRVIKRFHVIAGRDPASAAENVLVPVHPISRYDSSSTGDDAAGIVMHHIVSHEGSQRGGKTLGIAATICHTDPGAAGEDMVVADIRAVSQGLDASVHRVIDRVLRNHDVTAIRLNSGSLLVVINSIANTENGVSG